MAKRKQAPPKVHKEAVKNEVEGRNVGGGLEHTTQQHNQTTTKRQRPNPKPSKQDNANQTDSHDIVGGLKDPTGNTRSTGSTTDDTEKISHLKIPFDDKQIVCEKRHVSSSPKNSDVLSLVFTHGAGGGIENPATQDFVTGFASSAGDDLVCFQGTMNLSHRTKTFHAVLEDQGRASALGGRSMGARAAVITSTACGEDLRPDAVVLVSYPLASEKGRTTKGKGQSDLDPRKQILLDLPKDVNVLFVTGSKDAMCDLTALGVVRKDMQARSWVMEVKGADHGMSLTPKAAVQPLRLRTGALAAEWLQSRDKGRTYASLEWSKEDEEVVFSGWSTEETDDAPKKKRKK